MPAWLCDICIIFLFFCIRVGYIAEAIPCLCEHTQWAFDVKLMSIIIDVKKHVKNKWQIDVKSSTSIWHSDIAVTKTLKKKRNHWKHKNK